MAVSDVLAVARWTTLAFILIGAFGVLLRFSLWMRGQPARVPLVRGLLSVPKRYLVDLHDVVARERLSARMHAAVAGGLLAALAAHWAELAVGPSRPLHFVGLAAAAVMTLGFLLVAYRRLRHPSPRRSAGEWRRFVIALGLLAAGLLGWFSGPLQDDSIRLVVSLGLIILGSCEVLIGMGWGGPLRHALAGALNLAWHPRPLRFRKGALDVGLKPADLAAEQPGVKAASDLPWNRILNLDACVQCGRCEAACPAFAAGQPLNPKAFVSDVARSAGLGALMGRYAGSPHPHLPAKPATGAEIVPNWVAEETLWACTTCRACVWECPMLIEHVDMMIDLRRTQALETGRIPGRGPLVIQNLRDTDNTRAESGASRFGWAFDLDLPIAEPGRAVDVLWWIGDAGFDTRNRRTLRAMATLLRQGGVNFAVLGPDELDCGDTARRLGEEAVFQELARRNISALSRLRFNRIMTTDPHVMNSLRNDYVGMGANYEVLHHTELLAQLVQAHKLVVVHRSMEALTYHDPCYLARWNAETTAPRIVLDAIAPKTIELVRSGTRTRCCGGGGGAPLTDIVGERRIPDMRMDDVRQSGATTVAVACPNCMTMLEGVSSPRAEVADIAELLLRACGLEEAL